jgi:hypothetical protein
MEAKVRRFRCFFLVHTAPVYPQEMHKAQLSEYNDHIGSNKPHVARNIKLIYFL